jgi:hypothetical protein
MVALLRTPLAWPSAGWYAADARCRTRRRNAHGTGILGEREVLYRWHPWAGRVVGIHEVIERATGNVARCRVTPGAGGRLLEVPVWMFDRASCHAMRLAPGPRVDLAALVALRALFAETIRRSDAANPDRLDDALAGRAPAMPAGDRAAGGRR